MPISRVNHRIVSSLAQSHLNVTPVMNPITRVPPCHGVILVPLSGWLFPGPMPPLSEMTILSEFFTSLSRGVPRSHLPSQSPAPEAKS
eukprot:m.249375 g.249375  ORF g.249375 m.249375 type:complete len:88 (+) comp15878_c0_seq4:2738-3001(+)